MVIPEHLNNDILPVMKRFLIVWLFCLVSAANAAEETLALLGAEFWFEPRHGGAVVEHAGVRAALKKLIAEPEAYLVVRYPATEFGELWGLELQAWLVSLGLVSDRIELQSGFDQHDAVALVVVAPDIEENGMIESAGPESQTAQQDEMAVHVDMSPSENANAPVTIQDAEEVKVGTE